MQGSYFFNDFKDRVAGTSNGAFFSSELDIKNPRDINVGLNLQIMAPSNVKFYLGPYYYYWEAGACQSPGIAGLPIASGQSLRNNANFGVLAGADMPIGKGFHLNIESQYSERISAGAAITFAY